MSVASISIIVRRVFFKYVVNKMISFSPFSPPYSNHVCTISKIKLFLAKSKQVRIGLIQILAMRRIMLKAQAYFTYSSKKLTN